MRWHESLNSVYLEQNVLFYPLIFVYIKAMVETFAQQADELNFNLTKSLIGKLCAAELQASGIYIFIVDAFNDTKIVVRAMFILYL